MKIRHFNLILKLSKQLVCADKLNYKTCIDCFRQIHYKLLCETDLIVVRRIDNKMIKVEIDWIFHYYNKFSNQNDVEDARNIWKDNNEQVTT